MLTRRALAPLGLLAALCTPARAQPAAAGVRMPPLPCATQPGDIVGLLLDGSGAPAGTVVTFGQAFAPGALPRDALQVLWRVQEAFLLAAFKAVDADFEPGLDGDIHRGGAHFAQRRGFRLRDALKGLLFAPFERGFQIGLCRQPKHPAFAKVIQQVG